MGCRCSPGLEPVDVRHLVHMGAGLVLMWLVEGSDCPASYVLVDWHEASIDFWKEEEEGRGGGGGW